jgi:hypothetical protein
MKNHVQTKRRLKLKYKRRDPERLDINIQIDATAWAKILLWTDMAMGEFSALGLVEELDDTLRVTQVFLLEQQCDGAGTEIDQAAVAQLMMEGVDPGKLRCWIHSHADMQVFWSKTDDECIQGLANGEWLLSLVVNKQHESMMRIDQFHPTQIYLEDVIWEVHYQIDEELEAQCKSEFKKKVRESEFIPIMSRSDIRMYGELEEAMDWQEWEEELCDI